MDGILVVDKPAGMTSHDVVNRVRRCFNVRRVGHAGTLDPMATGVLVILIGRATKLSSTFMNDDKEYIATLFLGKRTDTQDATGKVLEEKDLNGVDVNSVKNALDSFLGEIEQVPPMVSAKKYKGKKLYELARKGESIPRSPCNIKIHEIELLEFDLPEIIFRVRCSKGTYVRTLCEDIGKSLGYPAHMSALARTRSGRFLLDQAQDLNNIHEKNLQSV
ncbi:MAG: tRNA pseudouridine(55) synthase TruB [Candidatus Omnitrophica bacterium]|nr:tRNA pseudouridine(55) synthase TruB [Candidatus Omnitrophota bacterium]